tara:strand:- start:7 stop:429 length:423 start_codon:yes stop_codon:yes gene_type:complete
MILFFPNFAPDTCDFRMISIECIKQIITASPGLTSKDIAKMLTKQLNTHIIKEQINKKYTAILHANNFDIDWPGIYAIQGIIHTDFKHYSIIIKEIPVVLDEIDDDNAEIPALVLALAPLAIANDAKPRIKAKARLVSVA